MPAIAAVIVAVSSAGVVGQVMNERSLYDRHGKDQLLRALGPMKNDIVERK